MSKIKFIVIQPNTIKIDGEFDHIIVPGVDGDFGISEDHTPFITKIRSGILKTYKNSRKEQYAIHDGFVTVENNKVTVICDVIESTVEIDRNRAEQSKERAEKRLKSNKEDVDFRRAESALKRSLVRLSLTK
ncbi:MAG: ATP synthase F1 subunit epsilon [Candidatus Cloacimonetes bacterium]|nr:ATP synthase F1 subunit epsilon [Candidatus Cloacimonadota bacterium]